jgi:leader peptidase (prepilin peptidase)/N-methyltransferase
VLGLRDLVPLVSWLVTRARCRYCRHRLSLWYPAIEVSALVVAVWSVVVVPAGLAWASALYGWALLTLAVIDLRWLWLPHALTVPLAAAGLLVSGLWGWQVPFDQLLGAVFGYLTLALVAQLYRRYRAREGLGGGDAVLFAALGAWVGWQGLPTVLIYAGISGLLLIAVQRWSGQTVDLTTRIPFGPHLCLGGWLVWLYGSLYIQW